MLTKPQEQKYWRTWARILACRGWAHESTAKKNERRHATHIMCGLKNPDGTARSMKSFENRDFSRWLAATSHLCDEVDIRDRDRENAVWRIRQDARAAGLTDEYLHNLARDLYDAGDWTALPNPQLFNFRDTIHNRATAKTGHDTRGAAPVQPRRKYVLDGGERQLRRIPGSARAPRAVTGDSPVTPPATSLKYCMHAVKPPTKLPPAPLAPAHHLDDSQPF